MTYNGIKCPYCGDMCDYYNLGIDITKYDEIVECTFCDKKFRVVIDCNVDFESEPLT